MTPANPDSKPESTKSQNLIRLTRIPAKNAASDLHRSRRSSGRAAWRAARRRTRPPAPRRTRSSTGCTCRESADADVRQAGGSRRRVGREDARARPRKSVRVPIVTASEGRPSRGDEEAVECTEQQAPSDDAPGPSPARSASRASTARPSRRRRARGSTATERSISPVITIRVSGSAMIATSPTFRPMEKRFPLQEVRERRSRRTAIVAAEQDHEQGLPATSRERQSAASATGCGSRRA